MKKRGFTLVELLVVMALVAVLSVLTIGAITIARQTARNTKRLSDAKTLQAVLENYSSKNKTYIVGGWHDFSFCPAIDSDPIPAINGNCSGLIRILVNGGYISREIIKQNSGGILYCGVSTNSYKLWVLNEPTISMYPGSPSDCSQTIYPGYTDLSIYNN